MEIRLHCLDYVPAAVGNKKDRATLELQRTYESKNKPEESNHEVKTTPQGHHTTHKADVSLQSGLFFSFFYYNTAREKELPKIQKEHKLAQHRNLRLLESSHVERPQLSEIHTRNPVFRLC